MDNRPSPGDISRILWTGKESSKKMSPGTCGGVSSQLEISHVTSDGVRLEELAPRARRNRATGSGGRASEPVTRFRGAGRPSNRLMRAMWNWARPLHLIHGGASSLWVGLRGVGRDAERRARRAIERATAPGRRGQRRRPQEGRHLLKRAGALVLDNDISHRRGRSGRRVNHETVATENPVVAAT